MGFRRGGIVEIDLAGASVAHSTHILARSSYDSGRLAAVHVFVSWRRGIPAGPDQENPAGASVDMSMPPASPDVKNWVKSSWLSTPRRCRASHSTLEDHSAPRRHWRPVAMR